MDMTINHLESITWYWLKMNDAHLEKIYPAPEARIKETVPAQVLSKRSLSPSMDAINAGMGKEMAQFIHSSCSKYYSYMTAGENIVAQPLYLTFDYQTGDRNVNSLELRTEAHSMMTVIEDFTSAQDGEGFSAVQTKLDLKEGSVLKLIQIDRFGSGFTFLNDVGGRVADHARVELIHLVLGGKNTYIGVQVDLEGRGASIKADIAYRVKDEGTLDINYLVNHKGKNTESQIDARGVLRGHSNKIFRGTIDFKRGSSGSVGNEREDVLMMDENVRSRTIPIILCSEEDVVGNHGATVGRLDENILYYLESRGMDKDSVFEMMAEAKIQQVVDLIDDEKAKSSVIGWLKKKEGRSP